MSADAAGGVAVRGPATRPRGGRRRSLPVLWVAASLVIGSAGAGAAPAGRPARPGSPTAAPAPGAFHVPAPVKTVLKNGLVLLVLERPGIPLVQMQLLVRAGAASDPAGKEGTAALAAQLLKRGTAGRSAQQFAEEVEFVGGTLEATAGRDGTIVAGEFASRDFEVGLNLLADMVQHPAFKEEEFARAQRQAVAEALSGLDDPEHVADEAFDRWLFGTHPYGRPTEGTRRSLGAIGRADVAAFYESHFAPNACVLAVVGDIGAPQAAQRVGKYFGGWARRAVSEPRLPEIAPVKGRRVLLVDKPDATQAQIRFGNVGLRRADPEYFPLLVGNTILGGGFTSWLVDEVRTKRGLTYGIRSRLDARRAGGAVEVETFSKNPTVAETIRVSLDQIKRLRDGAVPPEDLEKARSFLAGIFPVRVESPDSLAHQILEIELYGLETDFINVYQKRVRSVSLEEVKRAAARFMPLDDLAVVVVGPAATLKEPLSALGPVTVRPIDAALD